MVKPKLVPEKKVLEKHHLSSYITGGAWLGLATHAAFMGTSVTQVLNDFGNRLRMHYIKHRKVDLETLGIHMYTEDFRND